MNVEKLMPTLRLKTPVRISLNRILIPELNKLHGNVLDIGAGKKCSDYYFDMYKTGAYYSLDIDKSTGADIICPIENMYKIKDCSFDNVVAIEVLEHCAEPKKAIDEIYRALRNRGKCILTTRFVYPYHLNPGDYFRFSEMGLKELFKKFKFVEIKSQGNRFMLWWEMVNCNYFTRSIFNIFNWIISLFDFRDKKYSMGYMVMAIK